MCVEHMAKTPYGLDGYKTLHAENNFKKMEDDYISFRNGFMKWLEIRNSGGRKEQSKFINMKQTTRNAFLALEKKSDSFLQKKSTK